MTTYSSFKPSFQFLADSIAGETTTTESVGRMHSSATFIGGTGTSQSWYNGQKVSDQLASVDEAEFDQDQEEVGGKWGDRWNKFKKVVDGIDKIKNEGRRAGFWDEHEPVSGDTLDSGFDQLNDSAFDSLTGSQAATNNSIYQDADVGGDEAVGGKGRVILKGIKYGYQAYQMGREFGLWDEAETISPDLNGPLDSFGEMPAGYVPGEHDFNPSGVNPVIPGIDASFGTNTEIPLA